ncbi:porin [Campylobacterota bacterium]|nr:porin [Campylobacterota bacterium]
MKTIKFSVVAAAALALSSSAFAADGLTAYGQISGEVGSYFNSVKNGNLLGTHSYASRFGLKGAADVGGGLTAVYQVEVGFNPVNGDLQLGAKSGDVDNELTNSGGNGLPNHGDALSGRNTFVGIAGGFGTFVIGNHDTPYKIAARGSGAITSADTVADLHLQTDRRLRGAVAYIAPADALGGTTLAVALVPVTGPKKGVATDTSTGFHYSIGAVIPVEDIGLKIGLGYESAYATLYDDRVNSLFAAASIKLDTISVGLAVESVTQGDDIGGPNAGKDHGTTTVLIPFSIGLDDGLYVNAGVKYTLFDKLGAAATANSIGTEDPDENILQVSAAFGKKWASNLDAYAGLKLTQAKNEVIGTGADQKKSATELGVGLKVAF